MLIAQIDYLTLNARKLTRPMCFALSRDARAAIACRSRVARVLCVSRLTAQHSTVQQPSRKSSATKDVFDVQMPWP